MFKNPRLLIFIALIIVVCRSLFGSWRATEIGQGAHFGVGVIIFGLLFFLWAITMFGSFRNVVIVLTAFTAVGATLVFCAAFTMAFAFHILGGQPITDPDGAFMTMVTFAKEFWHLVF
jgi:hypothetical protein